MSGGSWDYAYLRVQDIAERLCSSPYPERRALGVHLHDVARALHAIEWVDSGDHAKDGDLATIRIALGEQWPARVLAVLVQDAKALRQQLQDVITRVEMASPREEET